MVLTFLVTLSIDQPNWVTNDDNVFRESDTKLSSLPSRSSREIDIAEHWNFCLPLISTRIFVWCFTTVHNVSQTTEMFAVALSSAVPENHRDIDIYTVLWQCRLSESWSEWIMWCNLPEFRIDNGTRALIFLKVHW